MTQTGAAVQDRSWTAAVSPMKASQAAFSSLRNCEILPGDKRCIRLTRLVVSPAASFTAISRSRDLSVASQAGTSILLAASSAGMHVRSEMRISCQHSSSPSNLSSRSTVIFFRRRALLVRRIQLFS